MTHDLFYKTVTLWFPCLKIFSQIDLLEQYPSKQSAQGRRNQCGGEGGGGGGHRRHVPSLPLLNFFKGPKLPFFVMKSALFVQTCVQTNVAVNTNLKVPFVFPKYIHVCPLTQDNYVVNT